MLARREIDLHLAALDLDDFLRDADENDGTADAEEKKVQLVARLITKVTDYGDAYRLVTDPEQARY
jgi:hypothetical protein